MSDIIKLVDTLLDTFDKDISIINITSDKPDIKSKQNMTSNPSAKHKNGTIHIDTTSSSSLSTGNNDNNQSDKPKTPPSSTSSTKPVSIINDEEEKEEKKDEVSNDNNDNDEYDDKELDELSEEEALRLAMEMSMTDDDRQLLALVNKEIGEAQGHLSNWFNGNFKTIRDKNRAWCDFCKRLHHKFEMYRIEQGIIQPFPYQFFVQFLAMMYGTMKQKDIGQSNTLYIDQHKIKNVTILSADDDAIKYLRFKDGISKSELKDAVYARFSSLAIDPMEPTEWKFSHVMFVRSDKAPNGLLWTKWHMQ